MTFLIPALAWFGLAAAAIPIIIHLLNRRRFTRIDWAPMKYLKLTIQSNKRRLQIEQLILLMLRVLAMLLLFATVARPMISRGGFGEWLAGKQRKSQVIVIDDSMSMTQSLDDGGYVFDKAKSAAIEIVRKADVADQLTVFTVSNPTAPLVRQSQVDDAGDLVRAITDLKPSHLMNQWASTFESVDEYFQGAAYPTREAVLVTDLRAAGWNADIA
ncbi:MAG: BatA domain-containing protein, partial [Planctomycetales bacterium]|nr:BatA domain-containing protein [Planctomycetales bacterium]